MGELIKALEKHHTDDIYPFHMPGHKRQWSSLFNPYQYDITEIEGFDDLHNPEGLLKRISERIQDLYGCKEAFLLTNGSTSGILSAISSAIDIDDAVLIARNCHKSVYNAVFLRKGKTEYIYPQLDRETGITMPVLAEEVDKILCKKPHIKAVVITSPTYEGVISDIDEIVSVVHKYGALLIVDAAHGAHIGLYEGKTIAQSNADIVVMSLHKTLPCFTQSAMLCVNNPMLRDKVKKYIDIYETSSPSYLLMAGVESCLDYLTSNNVFEQYYKQLNYLKGEMQKLKHLRLFEPECSYDFSKIVISTYNSNISGVQLKNLLLNKYGIELEMASKHYALAMSSCMDTQEGFDRLLVALKEIDLTLLSEAQEGHYQSISCNKVLEVWECEGVETEIINLKDAFGYVSGEYIYAYPPGIPILVPGEVISEDIIEDLLRIHNTGIILRGISDNKIRVIQGKFYG